MSIPGWILDGAELALVVIVLSNILLLAWLLGARWYRRFRLNQLKGGLINYLGLSDWHASLSPREQALFRRYYNEVSNVPSQIDRLTDADIYSASETPAQLLVMVAASSMMNGDYGFAEKLLDKAGACTRSPWEKQQVLLACSYLFFKQRDQLSGARENCQNYSEKAIKNIERFGASDDLPPTLPYEQLITLNEEANDFRRAAEIAKRAADLFGPRHPELGRRFNRRREELLNRIGRG
jgi:hypothetical protein